MPHYDLLIKPKFIIPIENQLDSASQYLENTALAIDNGRISALIPAHALAQVTANEVIELPTHALMPGFVNSHAHSAMVLFRGLGNDKPILEWLWQYIIPLETQCVSPTFVAEGTALAIAEMIQSGTTCFNDHYFFPEKAAHAALDAGMRANIGVMIMNHSVISSNATEAGFSHFLTAMTQPRHPLITYTLAPHGPYTVSDDAFKRIAHYADEYDVRIHLHLHESKKEIDDSLAEYGKRPMARMHELGILSPRLQAVHMTQINDEDWRLLAHTRPQIVSCPESNLKLASGFAPVQAFLDLGLNVAIGTDGAASNNDLDMLSEMRTLALLAKAVSNNAEAVSAHQALTMATLNGARALGLDHLIGSLIPGKAADLIAIDLSDLSTQPVYNPITQIVYAAGRHQVTHVWVNGKQLMCNRQLLTCDIDALQQIAQRWKARISELS